MSDNTEENEPITILGQEPALLLKYVYLVLLTLTAISLLFVFIPKGNANVQEYETAMRHMEQIQQQIATSDLPAEELERQLEEARLQLKEGSFKHQGVPLTLGLLTGLIGLCTFGLCVFMYFNKEEELGDTLHTHVKFLTALQLGYFIVGVILGIIFGSVAVLMFLIALALVSTQLYILVCGYKLLEAGERITKDRMIAQAKTLKTEIQTKIKSKVKSA